MTDKEKLSALKSALDQFLDEIKQLKQEHQEKIRQILKLIDERKLQEVRQKLEKI